MQMQLGHGRTSSAAGFTLQCCCRAWAEREQRPWRNATSRSTRTMAVRPLSFFILGSMNKLVDRMLGRIPLVQDKHTDHTFCDVVVALGNPHTRYRIKCPATRTKEFFPFSNRLN